MPLQAESVLNHAVEEHHRDGGERVHRVDGADLTAAQPEALVEPGREERPPDPPRGEEDEQRGRTLQIGAVL